MTEDRCAEVRADLPELALGLLDEPARGDDLAHVAGCPPCRAELDQLVRVVDRVVASTPEAEPPPGFEQRVLARLGTLERDGPGGAAPGIAPPGPPVAVVLTARARRSRRRWPTLAAVAAVVIALAAGVLVGRGDRDDRAGVLARVGISDLAVASLRTDDGEEVGSVAVARDGVPVVLMRLYRSRPGAPYECQLRLADGQVVSLGTWTSPTTDPSGWARALPELSSAPVEARVIVGDGRIWARGDLD